MGLIDYGEADGTMKKYNIDGDGTVEVQLETFHDDADVQSLFDDHQTAPASCQWMAKLLDTSLERLCGEDKPWLDKFLQRLHWANPQTCDEFKEDVTSGA